MQDPLYQAEGLKSNQGQTNLLLIRRRSRAQHGIGEFHKRRLLNSQQMLNDELLDDIQFNLYRIRPQTLLQRCPNSAQSCLE